MAQSEEMECALLQARDVLRIREPLHRSGGMFLPERIQFPAQLSHSVGKRWEQRDRSDRKPMPIPVRHLRKPQFSRLRHRFATTPLGMTNLGLLVFLRLIDRVDADAMGARAADAHDTRQPQPRETMDEKPARQILSARILL